MGIPFTLPMGFLLTVTMGKLFTMTPGIQVTISNSQLSADLNDLSPLTEEDLRLSEHGADLLRSIPFPAHVQLLSSSKILTHRLERYEGGRSPESPGSHIISLFVG